MKIFGGKLTILCSKDKVTIEIEDSVSGITFLDIELSPQAFTAALGRQACVPTREMNLNFVEGINKTRESKTISATIPKDTPYAKRKELGVYALLQKMEECPKEYSGWKLDCYLDSQNSFTYPTDNTLQVNAQVFRYVEMPISKEQQESIQQQKDWMEECKS